MNIFNKDLFSYSSKELKDLIVFHYNSYNSYHPSLAYSHSKITAENVLIKEVGHTSFMALPSSNLFYLGSLNVTPLYMSFDNTVKFINFFLDYLSFPTLDNRIYFNNSSALQFQQPTFFPNVFFNSIQGNYSYFQWSFYGVVFEIK